jgi:quercetin dioxygenase-like cupin family protein
MKPMLLRVELGSHSSPNSRARHHSPRANQMNNPEHSARVARRLIASMLIAGLQLAGDRSVDAQQARKEAAVTPLMQKGLGNLPGKEAILLSVAYLPGGASLPHRHDANVFVYVLEGSVIMQVEGHDPVTLGPGQTFYEGPDDIHVQSANASATKSAKFLVFMIKDKDKSVSRPVAGRSGSEARP